jgi:hypothetical protein
MDEILEKYRNEDRWWGKVILIEVYHLTMLTANTEWTLSDTAKFFDVSVALVSENLKLAKAMHVQKGIIHCKSRVEALRRVSK